MCGDKQTIPTASVRIRAWKRSRLETSSGNGPVDAVYNAITHLTGTRCELTSYTISANGAGMNALGEVNVTVNHEGRIFHGTGLSTDVIEASALALIHALNNIERAKRIKREAQKASKKAAKATSTAV